MKNVIVILLIFLGCTNLDAQETIARFKYEDAEKAFVAENYQECINNLDEAEKLLGKTAPNILHLKILAQHKLIEKDPYGDFELLEALHIGCATYLRDYDIAGLEEKYRDVYEVQNAIKEFPKTQAEYTAVIENQKQEIKMVFENYIDAIGGREALDQVKSLYIKGQQTMGKETTPFEEKIMQGKKSHTSYYYPRNKNAYGNAKKKKSELLNRTITTEDGTFIVDKGGNKKIIEGEMDEMPVESLFAEMGWVNLLDDPRYEFDLKNGEKSIGINISYHNKDYTHIAKIMCVYDAATFLLVSRTELRYAKDSSPSNLKITGSRFTYYDNYKEVGGIKFPFSMMGNFKVKSPEQTTLFKSKVEEVLINQDVSFADFE